MRLEEQGTGQRRFGQAEWQERISSMSERAEGTVADAGEAVQRTINQVSDTQEQVVDFIKQNPLSAVLIALGVGYVLGKIT